MILIGGVAHPKHGFKVFDELELHEVEDWIEEIEEALLTGEFIIWDGVPVETRDLTVMITYEHGISRLFHENTSPRDD